MKKVILLCCFLFLAGYLELFAQKYITNTQMVQITVQNEYTGVLDSPQAYALIETDLEVEFRSLTLPFFVESATIIMQNGLCVAKRTGQWLLDDDILFFVTVHKPGHRLDRVSTICCFKVPVYSDNYTERNGAVLQIPPITKE